MASPTQNHSRAYDVFLNHRGPNTKNGFAGHLYNSLCLHGIRVFLDKKEMEEGEEITQQIETAIKTASVHVAIFSKNYAESHWCLKELVLMLESRESGATVIPIFYDVTPSILTASQTQETQQGQGQITEPTYAEQLQELKNKRLLDENIIAKWKEALKTAAGLTGLELQKACNGYEGDLVEKIVKLVSEKVIRTPYNVPKYENIGLDVELKGVEDKVSSQQQQNRGPRVVGIYGLGGVGKTTLAKEYFHENSPAYRNSCFFPVRRIARTIPLECTTPLDYLFEELFVRLSGKPERCTNVDAVKNLFEGNNSKLDSVKNNPSLVILDGVENDEQAEKLLSIQKVLHSPGGENDEQAEKMEKLLSIQEVPHSRSLILITSRHRDVLTRSGVEDALIYKLNGLDAPWSRKLFCLHSFHQAAPSQGYEYLVGGFVGLCNGLPLLLEVFGAFLYGKNDRSYWEELLDGFQHQQIQPHEIEKKLKLIYDRLDIKEQQVFLDIAFFFIGESTDTALATRKGSGWKGSLWLQTLVEKRLVEVDRDYYIPMEVDKKYYIQIHHHLEDLGKSIAETREPLSLWPKTDLGLSIAQERKEPLSLWPKTDLGLSIAQETREPLSLWPKTDNYAELLHESPGITELQRNIDALSQQSSEQVKELRGFMQNILTMMSRNMPEKR